MKQVLRRRNREQEILTYRAPLTVIILFILFALAIVILSWVPPKNESSESVNTYAAYGTSLGVMILTGVLWQFMKGGFTRGGNESEKTDTEHGPPV